MQHDHHQDEVRTRRRQNKDQYPRSPSFFAWIRASNDRFDLAVTLAISLILTILLAVIWLLSVSTTLLDPFISESNADLLALVLLLLFLFDFSGCSILLSEYSEYIGKR